MKQKCCIVPSNSKPFQIKIIHHHELFVFSFVLLLSFVQPIGGQSGLTLDWTVQTPLDLPIVNYLLEYSPNKGKPSSPATFPSYIRETEIKNTLPGTDYKVTISIQLDNGQMFPIFDETLASSPEAPALESVTAGANDAEVSVFPPDAEELRYYIDYWPDDSMEDARFYETNSTVIKLKGLQPLTKYKFRVRTVYKDVTSKNAVEDSFITENGTSVPYAQPNKITAVKEGKMLRITWEAPEDGVNCSSYRVNYTVMTLSKPKTFREDVYGGREYLLIKFLENHILEIDVFCISGSGKVRTTLPAHILTDLRRPIPIKNLHAVASDTNEFFISQVTVAWDWPAGHSFATNQLVLSYYPSKAYKQRKDVVVNDTRPITIEKLKPTMPYTFIVRNFSHFGIKSRAKAFTIVTPPIISSTLYPGKITSTAININYSPTDVENAKFEKYELVFQKSDTENVTHPMPTSEKERSMTYRGLIPGKTYYFYLYTVYKNTRSRAVTANFTTYPLKVRNVLPIVGRDAVRLFWEPEESPIKEISYRISYSGSDGTDAEPIVVENVQNYTFRDLAADTWYTFSIIVVMGDVESDSDAKTVVMPSSGWHAPIALRSGPMTIEVTWRREMFSESNGVVANYAVLVAENAKDTIEADTFSLKLPIWAAMQDIPIWPLYQSTQPDFQPFTTGRQSDTKFVIGSEDCKEDGENYCNGPLKPETEYQIRIRACTNEGICVISDACKAATQASLQKKINQNEVRYLNSAPNLQAKSLYIFIIIFIVHILFTSNCL